MKRIITAVILTAGTLFAGNVQAQVKIGYIRIDDMVAVMPETGKIDAQLEQFIKDSLTPKYNDVVAMYQYKDSVYRDSLRTPKAIRKQIEDELPGIIYQIQNWQQIQNQALETKQNEILAPIYRKVYDAVKLVAKEKGYTHVLTKEALLVAPDADDLIKPVAAKLNVVLPKTTTGN